MLSAIVASTGADFGACVVAADGTLAGFLTDGPSEDGSIHQDEIALVEEVSNGLNQLVAHPGYGRLASVSKPQVSMFKEESRPMLFRTDGIVRTGAEHVEGLHR
jgi:citrate synthase